MTSCSVYTEIIIDLGSRRAVTEITYYPYYGESRSYCTQSIAVSTTGAFAGEETGLFSCGTYAECGAETESGRTGAISGSVLAQYIRIRCGRNT
eukprot:2799772-Rhodomonas_salina.1